MVKKSQRLAVQIYEQQLENDRSRYKQLQSQINPHFLYNSLFIIYRLAKMEDCDTIAYFSQKLGEYFRYVTRSGRDEVPLSEELVHVRSYVEIQTIRFANRIQVHFEALPAHLQSLPVPRLILQPIVENCYEHGFEDQPEGGEIDIRFHEDAQGLCILVENTGSTIEAGKIEQICADIHTDSIRVESTGVVNVGRRLRLRYGERGRLRMEPRKGGGVRVSLYIPYAGGEGGKNEV